MKNMRKFDYGDEIHLKNTLFALILNRLAKNEFEEAIILCKVLLELDLLIDRITQELVKFDISHNDISNEYIYEICSSFKLQKTQHIDDKIHLSNLLTQRGDQYFSQEQYLNALIFYHAALEISADNKRALFGKGRVYLLQSYFIESLKFFNYFLSLNSDVEVEKLASQAIVSVAKGAEQSNNLTMNGINLRESQIPFIAEQIPHLSNLVSLSLSNNNIGEKFIAILLSSIRALNRLKKLNLDGCKLNDSAGKAVAVFLEENISVKKLSISDNFMTAHGFFDILESLSRNVSTSIRKIIAKNNRLYFGEAYWDKFTACTIEIKKLRKIDVTHNYLRPYCQSFLMQRHGVFCSNVSPRESYFYEDFSVDQKQWFIHLMATKSVTKQHALILIEGMYPTGQLFFLRFDLFCGENKKACISEKECDPQELQEILRKYKYHSNSSWLRGKSTVEKLVLDFREDKGKGHFIDYSKFGSQSVGYQNCLTYLKKKLQGIGIEININNYIAIPTLAVQDDSSSSNKLPTKKEYCYVM